MKKNCKLVIACIICAMLSISIIGGNFSITNSTKRINKVYAAANNDGIIGTKNLNYTAENSAKVGDQLHEPEKGWKRI